MMRQRRLVMSAANPSRYWTPGELGHAMVLGPIFGVHEAHRLRRVAEGGDPDQLWEWTEPRVVAEVLQVVWHMTGRWQARRVETVGRRAFDTRVGRVVVRLARVLNRLGVGCLRDMLRLSDAGERTVVSAVHRAVHDISSLRRTRRVEPVFGSKVLHHYFPSIVPVFDTALIRRGALRTPAFRRFLDENTDWLVYLDADAADGEAMLEFHRYFGFCTQQVGSVSSALLHRLRTRFGRGFMQVAPFGLVRNRKSLLWRLDAKLAEYCFLGEARRVGLL